MLRNLFYLYFVLMLGLTGCSSSVQEVKKIFHHNKTKDIYVFNVAKIEIINEDHNSDVGNFVSGISPKNALMEWCNGKFRSSGTSGTLTIIIRKAQLVNNAELIDSFLSPQDIPQTEHDTATYQGNYVIDLYIDNPQISRRISTISINIVNKRTIQGTFTLADKQIVWMDQTKELLQLLGNEIIDKVEAELAPYIIKIIKS